MSNSELWQLKLNALLHDPPDKSLDIQGHQGKAQTWARILGLTLGKQAFQEADWIASAADRLNFPSYRSIGGADFRRQPYLTHPLAGERLNLSNGRFLPTSINETALQKAIQESLESIPDAIKKDPKKLFLWLWRNWSNQIQTVRGNQLGPLWDLLPADTRIPDHSIWAHQALTSAIAAALPQPAFLLFTLGPVQAFISAARKTQDLWTGSYLLSYLNWAAIEVIAETIGPDAVIFPNLLGQPLCDRWLHSLGISPPPQTENLILPSLPNRFCAIVPAARGAELAQQAANRVRAQWHSIAQTVRQDLESVLGSSINWSETWERQTENLFETYWQIYPWKPKGNEPTQAKEFHQFLDSHVSYLGDRAPDITEILNVYARADAEGGQYQPNIGAIYSDLYYITEKALGSRKGLRNFPQVEESGEKSTLGGDRATLYDGVDRENLSEGDFDRGRRRQIIQFWERLTSELQRRGRFELQEGGQERLDAVELTKRCAWRSYFQRHLGIRTADLATETDYQLRFPSTSSVATASFKESVLTVLGQEDCSSLSQGLAEWMSAVRRSPIIKGNVVRWDVIPYLSEKVNQSQLNQPNRELLINFLRLDGRLLFEEIYLPEQYELSKPDQSQLKIALNALKAFLKTAENYSIPKPRKYFAILMMDGDEMGKWIAGDKMPLYQEVLHPQTKKALEQKQYWQPILETKRLMSPAIHGFISKALGDFSLILVRHIVETRYPGKLVYAGGDDVMALLPLNCALRVARELRAAFSGEINSGEDAKGFEVKFDDRRTRTGYLWLQLDGSSQPKLYATMGHKATASTGIAIANYKQPLDLTLQEVRQAEKAAKNQEGRNAFSLTFLKRSGEVMTAGAKWTYKREEDIVDTVAVLLEFQRQFAADAISGKFPYVLRQEAETLALLEDESLYTSEIRRLLKRQQGGKPMTSEARTQLAENLAQKLSHLVMQANRAKIAEVKDEDKQKPQGKLKVFADLLVFTRFLATAEGED